eukprot:3807307-Rhodomonas_salina.1
MTPPVPACATDARFRFPSGGKPIQCPFCVFSVHSVCFRKTNRHPLTPRTRPEDECVEKR